VSAPTRDEAVVWADLVRMVHRQMRSLVGGGHRDLEDLAQAALERLVVALPRFEGRAELSTFTYRLCAHVAMDHWRGWRRWAKRFQFWTEHAAELPAASEPAAECLAGERVRRLYACLERLAPAKRICVTLAELEELTASRIADILECPEATVRSRLRAGRAELAAMLRRDPLFRGEEAVDV
jgi:RNA polymerase sigma-70 factor (ECF subfamily)